MTTAVLIFDRLKTALILGGVFTVSSIVNYVILKMEDMALITGTIILIVVLAFLMYITGRLNRK